MTAHPDIEVRNLTTKAIGLARQKRLGGYAAYSLVSDITKSFGRATLSNFTE